MRKIVISTFIALYFCAGLQAQQGYEVTLDIKNLGGGKVMLMFSRGTAFIMDSAAEVNGIYTFKGRVDEPTMATVMVRKPNLGIKMGDGGFLAQPLLQIALTNDKIHVTADANKMYMAEVKGGFLNEDWNKIRGKQAELTDKSWTASKEGYNKFAATKDSSILKNMRVIRDETWKQQEEMINQFIDQNPGSLMSMFYLSQKVGGMPIDELETAYNKLGPEYKNTSYAKRITDKVSGMRAADIGKGAIEINKKDMNGNAVTLATLRGKYVLLDFWGSWCGPCRQGHPHLKEMYAKYKAKGFEIVGVAQEHGATMEENKKAWMDAIKQDGISWIQVLNNEGKETFDAVQSYGVSNYPTKILLDKQGKIIGRYVGEGPGNEFGKKMKEIFGE